MKAKSVVDNIKINFNKFTRTQKIIADYICENSRLIPAMSVQELAATLNISDASIIRFAQFIGYKGYLEMRALLKAESNQYYLPQSRFSRTLEGKLMADSRIKSRKMYDIVAQNDFECIKDFYDNFDRNNVVKVADEINNAETIYIVGFGTDSVPATFLHWYLQVMGYSCICCKEGDFTTSKVISNIEENDLLIMFSAPRHLKIEKAVLRTTRNSGARIIGVSPDSSLELYSLCDLSIRISDRSNELLNSYVAYMSFCNMLIVAVYEKNKKYIDKKLEKNEEIDGLFDLII